jgi:hypothetical protein
MSGAFSCDSTASMRNLSQQTEAHYIAFVSDLAKRAASPSAEECCARRPPLVSRILHSPEAARVAAVGCKAGDPQARQSGSLTETANRRMLCWGDVDVWSVQCPRPDSNGHARYGHRPSTCRVYQFHHGGNTVGIITDSRPLSNACGMVNAKQLALFVNSFELSYTATRFPTFEIAGPPDSPPTSACQGDKACEFALSLTPAPRCPTSI